MPAAPENSAPVRLGPWHRGLNNWEDPRIIQPDELQLTHNVDIEVDGSIAPRRPLYCWPAALRNDQSTTYPIGALAGRHAQTGTNWATPDGLPTFISVHQQPDNTWRLGLNVALADANAVTNLSNLASAIGVTPYDYQILPPTRTVTGPFTANTVLIDLVEHTPPTGGQVIYALVDTLTGAANARQLIMTGPNVGSDPVYIAPTTTPVWTSIEDFDEGDGDDAVTIGTNAGYIPLGDTI